MGLDAILDAIRAEGEARVREIERGTYVQCHEMRAQARLEAQKIEEASFESVVAPASKERSRIFHHARLEILILTRNMREQLVNTAIDQARDTLSKIRDDQRYAKILGLLLKEALAELGEITSKSSEIQGGMPRIEVDRRDLELMTKLIREMDLSIPVYQGPDCLGGVYVKSADGKIVINNSIESRLERALPYLRSYLAALFEGEVVPVDSNISLEREGTP